LISNASINIGNIESAGMDDFEIWCARRGSNIAVLAVPDESVVALQAAEVLQRKGYEVVGKCVYPTSFKKSQMFSQLTGYPMRGSCFDATGVLVGIEVKILLDLDTFDKAFTETIRHTNERPNIKKAVIYCVGYSTRQVKSTCQHTVNEYNSHAPKPISIESLYEYWMEEQENQPCQYQYQRNKIDDDIKTSLKELRFLGFPPLN
jgi:hypothetical protein